MAINVFDAENVAAYGTIAIASAAPIGLAAPTYDADTPIYAAHASKIAAWAYAYADRLAAYVAYPARNAARW